MIENLNQQQLLIVIGISLGISLVRAYLGYEKTRQDFDFIHFIQTIKYYAVATIPVIAALAAEQVAGGGEISILGLVLAAAGAGTLGEILRVGTKKTVLSNEVTPQIRETATSNPSTTFTITGEAPNDTSDLHHDELNKNKNNHGRIYQNNFHQVTGQNPGNKLKVGEHLKIRIEGASSVSGRLTKLVNGTPQHVQIEQSGSPHNPWKDLIKFEMLDYDTATQTTTPMGPGKYQVVISYVKDGRIFGITDDFEIEP